MSRFDKLVVFITVETVYVVFVKTTLPRDLEEEAELRPQRSNASIIAGAESVPLGAGTTTQMFDVSVVEETSPPCVNRDKSSSDSKLVVVFRSIVSSMVSRRCSEGYTLSEALYMSAFHNVLVFRYLHHTCTV